MNKDMYYDGILEYITENGESGVNALAKHLDAPLSTVQRYLEKQKYFRKTASRKWDLPENVEADIQVNTKSLMVSSVENALKLIDAQLVELRSSVQNALLPVSTLKRAVDTPITSVANKNANIEPLLLEMDKKVKETQGLFKKYVGVCPEEYQELIRNFDITKAILELGSKVLNGDINSELSDLFLEKSTELSEDTLEILKEYQKES